MQKGPFRKKNQALFSTFLTQAEAETSEKKKEAYKR